jgi:myo-inositol-1(or 4)-monophosphatase
VHLEHARDVAERAARAGGDVIRAAAGVAGLMTKGPGDYVTETDLAAERAVVSVLREADPRIPVLAEEAGGALAGGLTWAVDPLDGTTNFVHGFVAVAVSVALLDDGIPVAGCVHGALLDQTFTGARGLGAEGPGGPLRVSKREPADAVVATGFPFRRKEVLPRYLRAFGAALRGFEDLRRPGAAALDLAWTAAGVFDGFFELGLSTWDVAAGVLLIEEAGGRTSDWTGGAGHVAGGDILAGNPGVHAELLAIARETAEGPEGPSGSNAAPRG